MTSETIETIEAFLGRLAARTATPGGGAVAALQAAQSAALVAMVARFSTHRGGEANEEEANEQEANEQEANEQETNEQEVTEQEVTEQEVTEQVSEMVKRADLFQRRGLALAAEDEQAFGAVAAALELPRSSSEQRAVRRVALDSALLGASEPPAAVVTLAEGLVGLAEPLEPLANRSTLADLAAAVEAAKAAAGTSGRNVTVNISRLEPSTVPNHLAQAPDQAARTIQRADAILATLHRRLED